MRDTTTGISYEKYMETMLTEASIPYTKQVTVGPGRTGRNHRIDLIIGETLVSLKYQDKSGTAEEKIPYEVMILDHLVRQFDQYNSAIIVLYGENGWRLKDFYLSESFQNEMNILWPNVKIMNHEQFCDYILNSLV